MPPTKPKLLIAALICAAIVFWTLFWVLGAADVKEPDATNWIGR